jgi:hypothetical protein
MVGSFVSVDYSTGPQRRPWTAEDAARLADTFTINGRATKPHVNTPGGTYVIGAVSLWCVNVIGQTTNGAPITCARRKRRADLLDVREGGMTRAWSWAAWANEPISDVARDEVQRLGVNGAVEVVKMLASRRHEGPLARRIRLSIEHALCEDHGVEVEHARRGT